MRGDRGGLLADLVGAVGSGAGCLLHGLGSGHADHDLHAVVLVRVAGRVLEAPLVHDAGRGGDVLVDVLAPLGCGDLAPHVARVGRIRGVVAALHLDGVGTGGVVVGSPAELAGIPVVELAVQRVADDAGLRADYGEVGCVVPAVDPLVLVDDLVAAIIERAVHQMVRQAVGGVFRHIVIRRETHAAIGLRLGLLDGAGGFVGRDGTGRVVRHRLHLAVGLGRLALGPGTDLAGLRLRAAVRVVAQPVRDLERQVVDQVAHVGFRFIQRSERERADRRVRRDRDLALVGRPLTVMTVMIRVGRVGDDVRTRPTGLVPGLVAADSGHGHGLAVDQRLHPVGMLGTQCRMVETHRVHGVRAVPRVDLLIDAFADFAADDLRVRIARAVVPLQFDAVCMVGDEALGFPAFLVGDPPEFGGVETVPFHPCGVPVRDIRVADVLPVDRVDACEPAS